MRPCTIVLQDVTTEGNWVKGIVFYNCLGIYKSQNKKRLIKKITTVLSNYVGGISTAIWFMCNMG